MSTASEPLRLARWTSMCTLVTSGQVASNTLRAGLGHLAHRLGDAVGGEDDDAVVRHLIQLFDEDGARLLELVHHVAVVHHFVTDIDGGTELLQRALDDADRPVDTGTETTGLARRIFISEPSPRHQLPGSPPRR
jgi:hypothetical protein